MKFYLSKKKFIKLVTEVLEEFLEELPPELRDKAVEISVQIREKPSWKELTGMKVNKLFAYINPGWRFIRLFRIPILETTQPERLKESLRGILEHEFAHLFGMNDEEAWRAASKEEK